MKLLLLLCVGISFNFVTAKLNKEYVKEQWMIFKNDFNREYESKTEEKFRLKIFMDNLHYIEEHNKEYNEGRVTFNLGVNQFADKLHIEYLDTLMTETIVNEHDSFDYNNELSYSKPTPDSFDWSSKNAVTPVRNQGRCNACYAFAVVGSVETHQWKKTNKLVQLSEQNLIDCDANLGCRGGAIKLSFDYIADKGIDTAESYRYKIKKNKTCSFNPNTIGARISGSAYVKQNDERIMKEILYNEGPLAATFDIKYQSFKFYKSGIFYEEKCRHDRNNHAMVVVGYGIDGMYDYWRVKNSWGSAWGEQGYVRMSRNRNNNCGIASNSMYPRK